VISFTTAVTPSFTTISKSISHPPLKTLPEDAFASIPEPESGEQVNIAADVTLGVAEQEASITPKENKNEQCEQSAEHQKSRNFPSLSTAEITPGSPSDCSTETTATSTTPDYWTIEEPEEESSDSELESDNISWDSSQFVLSRFFKSIMDERQHRQRELLTIERDRQSRHQQILLIQKGKQELEEERQQLAHLRQLIDKEKQDFENVKVELEPTIPLAKQLLSMHIDIRHFLPYVDILTDYSQANNTDLTTAAFKIVEYFKTHKELKTLKDSIEEAQRINQQLKSEKQQTEQQLAMLRMSVAKYQNAISALNDLQSAGFNTTQIAELTGLVNTWNGLSGTGGLNIFGQGNGSGSKSKLEDKLIKKDK
jgi:hypothetical protein